MWYRVCLKDNVSSVTSHCIAVSKEHNLTQWPIMKRTTVWLHKNYRRLLKTLETPLIYPLVQGTPQHSSKWFYSSRPKIRVPRDVKNRWLTYWRLHTQNTETTQDCLNGISTTGQPLLMEESMRTLRASGKRSCQRFFSVGKKYGDIALLAKSWKHGAQK